MTLFGAGTVLYVASIAARHAVALSQALTFSPKFLQTV
jgi:hypothetical protein